MVTGPHRQTREAFAGVATRSRIPLVCRSRKMPRGTPTTVHPPSQHQALRPTCSIRSATFTSMVSETFIYTETTTRKSLYLSCLRGFLKCRAEVRAWTLSTENPIATAEPTSFFALLSLSSFADRRFLHDNISCLRVPAHATLPKAACDIQPPPPAKASQRRRAPS